MPPPPLAAVLRPVRVSAASTSPWVYMPPPYTPAWLPEIVLPVKDAIVKLPALKMPPPSPLALLPEIVLFVK